MKLGNTISSSIKKKKLFILLLIKLKHSYSSFASFVICCTERRNTFIAKSVSLKCKDRDTNHKHCSDTFHLKINAIHISEMVIKMQTKVKIKNFGFVANHKTLVYSVVFHIQLYQRLWKTQEKKWLHIAFMNSFHMHCQETPIVCRFYHDLEKIQSV